MQIELKNISKVYNNRRIIDGFDLNVADGDFVGIVGPSGSGKSTILNILGLFESYNGGNYLLNGSKAPRMNSSASNKFIRHHINYLFQNFALVEDFTVEKNLEMALHYTNLKKADKRKAIASVLEKVGMSGREKDLVATLSGGEQQRIAIARSFLKPGDLILADEPTASLDNVNRDRVFDLLMQLNHSGKTIVMVTHDLELAQRIPKVVQI